MFVIPDFINKFSSNYYGNDENFKGDHGCISNILEIHVVNNFIK